MIARTTHQASPGSGNDARQRLPKNVTTVTVQVTLFGLPAERARKSARGSGCALLAREVLPANAVRLSKPMGPQARARRRQRAFTLVELMIVVAMIGVMSTLAMVGYRKYIYSAQSSEAKNVIQMIRGAQEAYKAEMLQYLNASSSITSYYPNTAPNDKRYAWVYPSHGDYSGWRQLSVNPDAPVRFGYACIAGITPTNAMQSLSDFASPPALPTLNSGTAWYEIQAKNDHNNNGVFAVFASTSLSGEIMSENETE